MELIIILGVISTFLFGYSLVATYHLSKNDSYKQTGESQKNEIAMLHQQIGELSEKKHELVDIVEDRTKDVQYLSDKLEEETEKSRKILSQKKSSETRLGQVAEQIAPFLSGCPYDPKTMSFLGQPIDFLVFDYDQGELVFLEVKSGNSKESARQKLIKNMIKHGKVYYEKMKINEKGVKITREKNHG